MSNYRPGDEPMTIKLPEGTDTSRFLKWLPKPCDGEGCEYTGIGFYGVGGRKSLSYCSLHRDEVIIRAQKGTCWEGVGPHD